MQNLSIQEKIEAIRQECIKVNPEIVELKFGCEVLIGEKRKFLIRKDAIEQGWCGLCNQHQLSGAAFTSFRCGYCKKNLSHPNTATPFYCDPCAIKNGRCKKCKSKMKIIGRPITLPDVLLAMKERKSSYYLGSEGRFMLCHGFNWTNEQNEVECGLFLTDVYWNLLKPLEEQEEPTINFIHDLLK